jgi:mono/diheme cytochrome c family protein
MLLGLIAALAACREDTSHLSAGPELYAKYCPTCHGADGKPPPAMELRLGVRDLTAPALRARITPAQVEQQLRRGSDNRLMPPFEGVLSDAQLRALAAWVASPAFLSPR